jgi:hypothetical protein
LLLDVAGRCRLAPVLVSSEHRKRHFDAANVDIDGPEPGAAEVLVNFARLDREVRRINEDFDRLGALAAAHHPRVASVLLACQASGTCGLVYSVLDRLVRGKAADLARLAEAAEAAETQGDTEGAAWVRRVAAALAAAGDVASVILARILVELSDAHAIPPSKREPISFATPGQLVTARPCRPNGPPRAVVAPLERAAMATAA